MENLELTLKLTVAETQIILAGLGKLPLEAGVSVWMAIKSQAEAQIQAAAQAVTMAPAEEADIT
jgi:hypothetical protein